MKHEWKLLAEVFLMLPGMQGAEIYEGSLQVGSESCVM